MKHRIKYLFDLLLARENKLPNNINLEKLLYIVIIEFQTKERLRRDDFSFDAFNYLSAKIGHKHSSTLRKMCGPKSSRSGAKLGFSDAVTIINETNDFRLFQYFRQNITQ